MIEFLNEMCEFDVYALSLERHKAGDGTEIIIPKLFPSYPPTVTTASRKKRQWSKESFFEDARKKGLSDIQLKVLKRIYNLSEKIVEGRGGIRWGKGGTYGSFRIFIEDLFEGKDIYTIGSIGWLTICFRNLYQAVAPEKTELVNKFAEQLYNIGILNEKITSKNSMEKGKQYPTIKPENWMDKIEDFEKAVEELIKNMKEYEKIE